MENGKPVRVLIVDDSKLVRSILRDILGHDDGITVVGEAGSGQEAVDQTSQLRPDLIIMDIQMPNVSGLDLIEAAKADATLRAIPVLAVTAYAGKGDEERIRDAGAEGYLAKPVSIGPFMAAVKALVEKAAA